jgi:predicted GIY-YIG superfamily endonuclease
LDVIDRVKKHNAKKGSKSVIAHGLPVILQCAIIQRNKSLALKLEAKIKKFNKKDKELFMDIIITHMIEGE